MVAPEAHESNLPEVNHQSFCWTCVNNSVVNHHERHQAHVPQEVLGCHDLVEGDEGPGLEDHGEKDVVMEKEAGDDPDTRLGNEHQESGHATRFDIVGLVNHVPVDRIVVPVVFAFEVVQQTLVQKLVAVNPVEKARKGS